MVSSALNTTLALRCFGKQFPAIFLEPITSVSFNKILDFR